MLLRNADIRLVSGGAWSGFLAQRVPPFTLRVGRPASVLEFVILVCRSTSWLSGELFETCYAAAATLERAHDLSQSFSIG